jgi:hypothetical protein
MNKWLCQGQLKAFGLGGAAMQMSNMETSDRHRVFWTLRSAQSLKMIQKSCGQKIYEFYFNPLDF